MKHMKKGLFPRCDSESNSTNIFLNMDGFQFHIYICSSHTNEFLRNYQIEQPEQRGRSKMGERERKQAALPILIFGEELVK